MLASSTMHQDQPHQKSTRHVLKPGIAEQRNNGTVEHWNSGTLEHRDTGTREHRNTPKHRNTEFDGVYFFHLQTM